MIFDAHSDLWSDVTARREAGERDVLARRHLPAMAEGGVEGSGFVLWADPIGGTDYVTATARLLAGAKAELAGCGQVRLVRTWAGIEEARRQGKFYIVLGVEGMAAIGDRPSGVDWYYARGVRWGMLTWNEENALATGAGGPAGSGLTAAGRQAVRRMEELGMVVDVSHLNDGGFRDVAALAQGAGQFHRFVDGGRGGDAVHIGNLVHRLAQNGPHRGGKLPERRFAVPPKGKIQRDAALQHTVKKRGGKGPVPAVQAAFLQGAVNCDIGIGAALLHPDQSLGGSLSRILQKASSPRPQPGRSVSHRFCVQTASPAAAAGPGR